jgi:WD40 repeat protein/serine/threonine protein kinase
MPCPDESELRQLAHGALSTRMAAALADHLDTCPDCNKQYDLLLSALQRPTVKAPQQAKQAAGGEGKGGGAGRGVPSRRHPNLGFGQETGRDAAAPQADLPQGAMLDHFRIMRPLGRGGMGRVYLARDTKLGRKVALKVLMSGEIGSKPAIDDFLREARTTARFNHPHIVTIHDVGEAGGLAYLALEYLEGQTLRQRLHEERPGIKESIRIALAIARALSVAHASSVLHRDLKPENVFMPGDGRLRVLDFGLARAAKSRADERQERRLLIGTPYYMSPEQWRGEGVSEASDVWALGLIMHELLTGRRPYRVKTAGELEAQVTDDEPLPSLRRHEHVPAELAELVDGCLAKEANRRPSAEEVGRRLTRMLDPRREQTGDEVESPFRGLLPFDEQHAGYFFGRGAETARFVERLRGQPVLPVVGPSGSGKSSFVRAGVIPRLRERGQWIVIETRPGNDPFGNLCSRFPESAEPGHSPIPSGATTVPDRPDRLADPEVPESSPPSPADLRQSPQTLAMVLRRMARNEGARVLLFVDQLEELYTHVADEATQRTYMQAICSAADDWQEPVRVVFTLRDDYLGRPVGGPMVQEALGQVTVLRGPAREALVEIVTRPLEMVDYRYDDEGLPGEMAEEVHGEPAALPMLQSAARTLWERRDRSRRLLLRAEYERMGGVAGALASHADSVLEGLSTTELGAARQILLRLVTGEGTRRVMLRSALLEGLDPRAEEVLRRLTQARLVTARRGGADEERSTPKQGAGARADGGQGGKQRAEELPSTPIRENAELELAHESLIQRWQTLARWLDESQDELVFLAEVEQAAELWRRRGGRESELWSGETLEDALRALRRCTTEVPGVVRSFLEAGERRQRRSRRRRIAAVVMGTLLVVAAAAIWVLTLAAKEREAREARRRAELLSRDAQLESAQFRHEKGQHLAARAWLRGSMELGVTREGRDLWLRLKEKPLLWQVDREHRIADLALTRGGQLAAIVADESPITILDLTRWTQRTLGKKGEGWFLAAFGPHGQRLAVARGPAKDPRARPVVEVWELGTGRRTRLEGVPERLKRLYLEEREVIGVAKEAIWRWDPKTGKGRHEVKPRSLHVALTDRGLLTASSVKTVVVRRGVAGEILRRYTPDFAFPFPFALRPDGRQLLLYEGPLKALKMVGLDRSEPPLVQLRTDDQAGHVAFSADSRRVAISYIGPKGQTWNRVDVWDVKGMNPVQTFETDQARLTSIALGPRGRLLLTGDRYGVVKVWRVGKGLANSVSRHPGLLNRLRFSPDGKRLAAGSVDGEILFWDPQAGRARNRYQAHRDAVTALAFSPDGKLLASGGVDSMLRLWDGHTGRKIRAIPAHGSTIVDVAFALDGQTIATVSTDRKARFWDTKTGKEQQSFSVPGGNGIVAVSFHPSGREMVLATWKGLRIYALPAGRLVREFTLHTMANGSARYNPAGYLVVQTATSRIQLVDTRTGEKLAEARHPMPGLSFRIHSMAQCMYQCGGPIRSCPDCSAIVMDGRLARLASITAERECAVDVAFYPEGRRLATVDRMGTVQVWELPAPQEAGSIDAPLESARRLWVGALLTARPPRLLGSRGMVDPTTGKAQVPLRAWQRAVIERGWLARTASDVLCLMAHDGNVELWDTKKDLRAGRWQGPISLDLEATRSGCALAARGSVTLFGFDGSSRGLEVEKITALGRVEGDLALVGEADVARYTPSGRLVSRRPFKGVRVTAVTGGGGVLAIGHINGVVQVARAGAAPELGVLSPTIRAPVSRLLLAPGQTLVAGYYSGHIAVWDLKTQKRLLLHRLHGPVRHLATKGNRIYAATGAGDHKVVDLSPLMVSECELLHEIWRDVPYTWRDDLPVLKAPASNHPCR